MLETKKGKLIKDGKEMTLAQYCGVKPDEKGKHSGRLVYVCKDAIHRYPAGHPLEFQSIIPDGKWEILSKHVVRQL